MNVYQPEKKCTNCLAFNVCNKKHKNKVCKNYKACQPPPPPKSGSLVMTPNGITYTPPQKQRTVLSVRDFAILYEIASRKLADIESDIRQLGLSKEEALTNPYYQDLLRIRDKLGELNIEVETPIVEVEE